MLKQEVNQPKEKSPAHINGDPCVRSFKDGNYGWTFRSDNLHGSPR